MAKSTHLVADMGARFLQFADRAAVELPSQGVAELSDADLADLEGKAVKAFEAIRDQAEVSDEDVAEAERLAEIVTAVRTESGTRVERSEGRKTKLAALGENIDGSKPVEAVDEAVEDGIAGEVSEEEAAELPELVAASAAGAVVERPRVRAAEVAGRQAKPAAPKRAPVALVAAADAPGRKIGSEFTNLDDVADAVLSRTSEYPSRPMPGTRTMMRHSIALLRKDVDASLVAASIKDEEVLYRAADQSRLPGGSLLAAGGWAAPSETLYDLAEIEAADGLVDLPEIQVNRGGVRFTPGPDFRSIYNGSGFLQTEAQAISNTTKPMYNVPVPAFTEVRAEAIGVGVTAGILQNRAYPELTARVIRGVIAAHAHKVSAETISQMVAGSTAIPTLSGVPAHGATTPVLNAIELMVEDVRYTHRMARTAVLEAVFPAWTFALLRADLANRNGVDSFMSVPDSQIMAWFTDRHIKPQFVYDWQDGGLGQTTAAVGYPTSLQFLLYPAGTFVRGMSEVISLDTVYDSASLVQNQYTALFSEESLLVAKLGFESRLVSVPVNVSGSVAAITHMFTATTDQ